MLYAEKARHSIINHIHNLFDQKLPKTKCYNVVCKYHIHLSTNNMLFVTNDANCSSYTHHIKELFYLPKEKDITPHQQLDFNDRYYIHGQ